MSWPEKREAAGLQVRADRHAREPSAGGVVVALTAEERATTECYWRIKRKPIDGSFGEAIREHSFACGLVGYVLGMHPDRVAEAVADEAKARR